MLLLDGLLPRDPRMVYRKKTGLGKARKRASRCVDVSWGGVLICAWVVYVGQALDVVQCVWQLYLHPWNQELPMAFIHSFAPPVRSHNPLRIYGRASSIGRRACPGRNPL